MKYSSPSDKVWTASESKLALVQLTKRLCFETKDNAPCVKNRCHAHGYVPVEHRNLSQEIYFRNCNRADRDCQKCCFSSQSIRNLSFSDSTWCCSELDPNWFSNATAGTRFINRTHTAHGISRRGAFMSRNQCRSTHNLHVGMKGAQIYSMFRIYCQWWKIRSLSFNLQASSGQLLILLRQI